MEIICGFLGRVAKIDGYFLKIILIFVGSSASKGWKEWIERPIVKAANFIIAMLLVLFSAVGLRAQSLNQGTHIIDAKLALKGVEVQGSHVIISYEIPYSGMVEIRLYDSEGQKIWQSQYADTFGKNRIILKATKFHPGETYAYQLNYKRDEVKETLVIPPLGLN